MAEPESDGITRRRFVAWAVAALAGLGTLFTAVPLVGSLVAKPSGATSEGFIPVGPTSALKPGKPTLLTFTDARQDAYVHETVARTVWAVAQPSGQVVVYSPVCPHLGCQYTWDSAAAHFICPCHTSIFTVDGKLISGPAPRGLDTLPSKIESGVLLVKWEQFQLATPQKIQIA
jgi:menaquinol-cytochrome c reductase iron-sulfur subunit